MSLTDKTYFKDPINLPAGLTDSLTNVILNYENDIIYDLFGYTLGELVIAYDENTSPQRIKDIVEGKTYTVPGNQCGRVNPSGDDITVNWNGLINDEKRSLIAFWCYYKWCRDKETFTTNAGGAKTKLENAENVGFSKKATTAWNSMIKLYGQTTDAAVIPSCYNFLYAHKEDYPEWVFKAEGYEPINMFGI